jgi:hypothetical protein
MGGAEGPFTLETSELRYKGCDQAKAQLHEYLKTIAELILPDLQREVHTNWNEAFNSNTARKSPKWLSQPVAYTPRVAMVMLGWNWGDNWILKAFAHYGFHNLSERAMRRLRAGFVVRQE